MPGTAAKRARRLSARPRISSRSSPLTLTAIWARTPESRWSSRWAIGWPTDTLAGRPARRVRMSAITWARGRPSGRRSTSSSLECTPSACSSSSARPVRRPTCSTSGTPRSRVSASCPTRSDSASAMPGWRITLTVRVPSLKGGRKLRGKKGTLAAAASTSASAASSPRPLLGSAQPSRRACAAFSCATSQPSPCIRRGIFGNSSTHSTGVTVTATARLARIATM